MEKNRAVINPIEKDMLPYPYSEEDKLSSKVFKTYPLIGDFVPADSTIEKWYAVTRTYIEKRLEKHSAKFNDRVYEQVTLTVIHFAKSWNSNEEGRFTKYVPMQLGYRDDNGRIWSLLSEALEKALKQNKRLFIERHGERQFYETVMAHSFGPNSAWYPLIDLLFTFYMDNLDWMYIPGDPLFHRLVHVLQGFFNKTDTADDLYDIASKKYRLRIGIRRLVQERPGYCAALIELITKRIHQLIKNEADEPKRYIYRVVDQWFADRISSSSEVNRKRPDTTQKTDELALDYSKINIRYVLSGGRPALRIPAIRILEEEQEQMTAVLYEGNRLLKKYELEVRGNELGETTKPKTLILPTEELSSSELQYRIVIMRGDTVIHDSGKKLFRQLVFFSGEKEISINRLRKEKYEVFIPKSGSLKGNNYDLSTLPNSMSEISLHKEFYLEYAGNTLALDTAEIRSLRIIRPTVFENARYVADGVEYSLVKNNASLKVYYEKDNESEKYRVEINGKDQLLSEYFDTTAENRSVIPIKEEHSGISLSIIDIAAGIVLFKENYYYIPDFSCSFNEKVYMTEDDFDHFSVKVECDGNSFNLGAAGRDEVCFDYDDGTVHIDIPRIALSFQGGGTLFFDKYLRAEDLLEDSKIRIANRTGIPYRVTVGELDLGDIPEIALSDYVPGEAVAEGIDVVLYAEEKKYLLAKIVFGNLFVNPPAFSFSDDCLYWDGGSSYIGDEETELRLVLSKDGKRRDSFELQLGETLIHEYEPDTFWDGRYDWSITADGVSIIRGTSFIGNASKARFDGKIIQIDRITEDIEGNSNYVPVKTVYIDQIRYRDTCYVETEEDIYDVYSGCMYWVDRYGERRYYSFKYNEKSSKYKLNPVKIIYISDKYLRIVTEDDEGIFYFYNDNSYDPGNEITDREPSSKAKNYHDILFYLFDTQDIKPKHTVSKPEKLQSLKALAAKKNPLPPAREEELPTKTEPEDAALFMQDPEPESETEQAVWVPPSLHNLQTVPQDVVIQAPVEARVLVNAGPGTGKTWTLIERIISLVRDGVLPEDIQVLCFSRAAVEVVWNRMKEAIATGRVAPTINLTDIRTFDSFASQLLYWVKDSDYEEIKKNYRIEALNYEQRIDLVIQVLKARPELIGQCRHLIVDEVQDLVLNRAEMVLEMIRLLPEDCGVTLFGDACQAIYDYQADSGMRSEEFYKSIEETHRFAYYSFDHNYRQVSRLQEYCEEYRETILANDVKGCNEKLSGLQEDLPDYNTERLLWFEEDSLDVLLQSGNVGILTRSNAQALEISNAFHKKNIPHVLQRRLSENYLNGWIAIMFNMLPDRYYDEESFMRAFSELFPDRYSDSDLSDIWNTITVTGSGAGNRISVSDFLRRVRIHGLASRLFLDKQDDPVTVSTIHRSKGREYDSVIILNSLLSENTDAMEEHRVNYVALSRAKEKIYKVTLPPIYARTLKSRRSYCFGKSFKTHKQYLQNFEVGRPGDFDSHSFCTREGVQEYLSDHYISLKDREVYLEQSRFENGYVVYDIKLKDNDMILGETGQTFASDLETAIRKTKNLPWHASVMDFLYPKRFTGIYITDVASDIGMVLGNEEGVREYDSLCTWNIILAEGFAKAGYREG